jgi:hypothetical protein
MEKDNDNMNSVTLRQWASPIDGTFPYVLDTSLVTLECLEAVGDTFANEFYQQVVLKANTDNCRWSYKLESADKSTWLTFEFIVKPAAAVESSGQLVDLNTLDFSSEQSIDVEAETFITMR